MKFGYTFGTVLALAFCVTESTWAQWTPLNIASNSSVNTLVVRGSQLLAGTDNGVFRTMNDGASWESLSNGLSWGYGVVPNVLSLAIAGDTLIAGTDGYYAYRSTNAGASWKGAGYGFAGKSVYALTVLGGVVFAGTDKGVYQSTNYGTSWSKAGTGLPSTHSSIVDVEAVGNTLLAASAYGVYVSTDHATSWSRSNAGFTDSNIVAFSISGNRVFAITSRKSVYRSTNAGATWMNVSNGLAIDSVRPNTVSIYAVGDTVYVGTSSGVFRSDDAGNHWAPANIGMPSSLGIYAGYKSLAMVHGYLFAGASGNKEFASSEVSLGIYRSGSNGGRWETRNAGLSNHYLHTYAGASHGSCVFMGANTSTFDWQQTFYRSTDNGEHWMSSNINEIDARGIIQRNDTLFAGTVTFSKNLSGVMISVDSGANWHMITDSLSRVKLSNGFQKKAGISVLAYNNGTMFCATLTGEVYRSFNSGVTWEMSDSSLPESVVAFSFDGSDVLVATSSGIYRSTNNGDVWNPDTAGIGAQNITALKTVGADVYAGTGTVPFVAFGTGAYVLHHGSNQWVPINNGLPQWSSVRTFNVNGGYIFAATDQGVFKTNNDGASWVSAAEGLSYPSIDWIETTDDYMFAASSTGIYRRPLAEMMQRATSVDAQPNPARAELAQNYPDPFSSVTLIQYALQHSDVVSLRVFNRLGQVVKVLAADIQEAGLHSLTMSSAGLQDGVYFYVLSTGGRTISRSMAIVH